MNVAEIIHFETERRQYRGRWSTKKMPKEIAVTLEGGNRVVLEHDKFAHMIPCPHCAARRLWKVLGDAEMFVCTGCYSTVYISVDDGGDSALAIAADEVLDAFYESRRKKGSKAEDGYKECAACGERLPVDCFDADPRRSDGYNRYCIGCAIDVKAAYANSKEKAKKAQPVPDNQSGIPGVLPSGAKRKPWKSQAKVSGKKKYLGSFETKAEAGYAYFAHKLKKGDNVFERWTPRDDESLEIGIELLGMCVASELLTGEESAAIVAKWRNR